MLCQLYGSDWKQKPFHIQLIIIQQRKNARGRIVGTQLPSDQHHWPLLQHSAISVHTYFKVHLHLENSLRASGCRNKQLADGSGQSWRKFWAHNSVWKSMRRKWKLPHHFNRVIPFTELAGHDVGRTPENTPVQLVFEKAWYKQLTSSPKAKAKYLFLTARNKGHGSLHLPSQVGLFASSAFPTRPLVKNLGMMPATKVDRSGVDDK